MRHIRLNRVSKSIKLIRHITDKLSDPYFKRSFKLKVQRQELRKDLLQPGQEGYQTYYKVEYDKIEQAREAYELKQKAKEKSKIDFYNKYSHTENKNLAKKVLAIEDKMDAGR